MEISDWNQTIPTIFSEAFINGLFALGASFFGAWSALKFQERHENKKNLSKKIESGLIVYSMLSEQLSILNSIRNEVEDNSSNGLWLTAISRLSDKTRSVIFEQQSLQIFLPEISSGLFRDILIAQNRFITSLEYLNHITDGDKVDAFKSLSKFEIEIDRAIILNKAVNSEFGDYMNNRYGTNLPKSELSQLVDDSFSSLLK